MSFRTFFFLLFIISSSLFFLSSLNPELTLKLWNSLYHKALMLDYIQLTSMSTATISLILFVIANHYAQKSLLRRKEKEARDRLNIESIHAELEALKH